MCGARLPWADAVAASRDGGYAVTNSSDESSVLLFVLGFFCWPAGIIVWALQRDQYPRRSASALNGAIASWVIGLILFGGIFLMGLSSRPVTTVFTSSRNMIVGAGPSTMGPRIANPKNAAGGVPPVPAWMKPTASPTPKPLSLYHRINVQMSYEEVVKAIGRKEDRKQVLPGSITYVWRQRAGEGDDANKGALLEVTFNEGSISGISQH